MALFTGTGTFNMSGGKLRDIEFNNGGTSLRLSGNGPTYITDVEFNGVTTAITGNAGGPPANNVTIENAWFENVTTAIEPYGDNWVLINCDTNIVTTFINSSAAHDYLRMAGCRTAGQINTNGTDRIDFEGNVYRGVIDLGTTVESVYISGVMENPGGTASALVQGTSVTGFTVDLQVYDGAGYDAPAFTDSQDGTIRGLYANVTGGVVLDGCTNVKVEGQVGADGIYLGGHGVTLTDCTGCEVTARVIGPGQDADNTFDGIILTGNSDGNFIHGNKIVGSSSSPQPRYAINVSAATCDNNAVVGNNFSDPSGTDYGTARFNDAGTGTITLWSSGGPNGDNIN